MRELIRNGPRRKEVTPKKAPTLSESFPTYIEEYCVAERQKASTIEHKHVMMNSYLLKHIGDLPLDQYTNAAIRRFKATLSALNAKTVNNPLCVLNTLLKAAVDAEVIAEMPCQIELLPIGGEGSPRVYDFEDYEKLVAAAKPSIRGTRCSRLLGGDAGLRRGEMIALEWRRVAFARSVLDVARSEWKGEMGTTKGRRTREVPMTARLQQALRAAGHLRHARVLVDDEGCPVGPKTLAAWMRAVEKKAGLAETGHLHVLRHTFCSLLAMRAAPARAIQALAGHADLTTTMGYMHLSSSSPREAIDLLARPRPATAGAAMKE